MIGTLGLNDPFRDDIEESVDRIMESGTNVRLFSGGCRHEVMSAALKLQLIETLD